MVRVIFAYYMLTVRSSLNLTRKPEGLITKVNVNEVPVEGTQKKNIFSMVVVGS